MVGVMLSNIIKGFYMKKIFFTLILIFSFLISSQGFAFASPKWDNPKSIRTYIEPNDKKDLMKDAFAKWTQETGNKIIFKYVSSPQNAQIKVEFVKDASKTSKREHAAGVTYYKYIGDQLIEARIEIADRAPNGAAFRKDAAYRIMLHEIGHAIGIVEHSSDPMSIMYFQKRSRNQAITQNEIKFLSQLYSW